MNTAATEIKEELLQFAYVEEPEKDDLAPSLEQVELALSKLPKKHRKVLESHTRHLAYNASNAATNKAIELLEDSKLSTLSNDLVEAEYAAVSDQSYITVTLANCDCSVTIDLTEIELAKTDEAKVSIERCTEHETGKDSLLRRFTEQYARSLWEADANAQFDPKYRELFNFLRGDF